MSSDDVVIQNAVNNGKEFYVIGDPPNTINNGSGGAIAAANELNKVTAVAAGQTLDAKPIVKSRDADLKAAHDRDEKLNQEYKALKDKPSMFRHPVKRADLWISYHENKYRKFRTRVLPAAQFAGVFVGMGFSIAGAL